MCAILDNDVVHQVFGKSRPQAGVEFFRWIDAGRIQLVVGGRLRRELGSNHAFKAWLQHKELVDNPRGRIYSTLAGGELRDSHRRLLRNNRCA